MNSTTQLEVVEFENTQKLCSMLLESPHYKKMGAEGIYAIVCKAKVVGVNPLLALEGGMYYVKGKVEMSAQMMNSIIRENKHSIKQDPSSDATICILHGKRADNGDTMSASFSIQEAQAAGLANNAVWKIYPSDMLFARALSRLGRRLFPDVLKGCYVEGEIQALNDPDMLNNEEKVDISLKPAETTNTFNFRSYEEAKILKDLLSQLPEYEKTIVDFMARKGFLSYQDLPLETYEKIIQNCENKLGEKKCIN